MFQPQEISRNEWLDRLNGLKSTLDEIGKSENKDDWDRLAYFTNTLMAGHEETMLINAGFKWLSNTKVADSFGIEEWKIAYKGVEQSLKALLDTFYTLITLHLSKSPNAEQESAPFVR